MNIWYIHHYSRLPLYGAPGRPYNLAISLGKLGYKVTVICATNHHLCQGPESMKLPYSLCNYEGVDYYYLPARPYCGNGVARLLNMLNFARSMKSLSRRIDRKELQKPDILIPSCPHPFLFFPSYKLARKYNAKIIYEELQYDSVYHEHLCYYTLKSVEELLNRFGLFVTDIDESPISGGSLILYIKKNRKRESPVVQSYRNAEKETKVNGLNSWENFAERVNSHRNQLFKILTDITEKDGPVVGYGASARSSTLLNFCGIDTHLVSVIADQNSLKHKHYTAGTHTPINSPEKVMREKPEYVLILAWNFSDEIIKLLRDKFNYVGKCILPLPNNPRIVSVGE